jgi:hypothetical protein
MGRSLIGLMRHAGWFLRSVSGVVLVTFTSLYMTPAVLAVEQIYSQQEMQAQATATAKGNMGQLLVKVRDELRVLADRPDVLDRKPKPEQRKAAKDALKALHQELKALDFEVRAEFAANQKLITDKKLASIVQGRQDAALKQYETEFTTLDSLLTTIETKDDEFAARASGATAHDWLSKQHIERSRSQFDPSRLPWGSSRSKVRDAFTSPSHFSELKPDLLIKVASTGGLADLVSGTDDPDSAMYLAPTVDAQITQAVIDLSASLGHDPVRIYNWVVNNIEFLPSYGSIQGAEHTLKSRKGNSFDTTSLLIALLRASGISTRYVYGTVEIPADQLMNWVGGVSSPMAAAQLLGQGGIPHTAITSGGNVVAVRLEHVWAEAWIDFHPSRGAKNQVGDTWVPMDASYKRFQFQTGLDMTSAVPFDGAQLAQQLVQSATIDPVTGSVSQTDQALIQNELASYENQIRNYLEAQNPRLTVEQVLGSKKIVQREAMTLAGSLPYRVAAVGWRTPSLGSAQRYTFDYALTDRYGGSILSFSSSTVQLAGRSLAIAFRPATPDDESVIASYIPPNVDSTTMPESLPGYLISLVPEFIVDGQVVASGPAVTMGTELKVSRGYAGPLPVLGPRSNVIIAGEYQAIGLDLGVITKHQLQLIEAQLVDSLARSTSGDISGVTRYGSIGAVLQKGILSFFSINDNQNEIDARFSRVVHLRLPSFGSFQTSLNPQYSFGVPRKVVFSGVLMDVDQIYDQVVAFDNHRATEVEYLRNVGPRYSANEHVVPEQLFRNPDHPMTAISATKAMSIASGQGQRIFTITASNVSNVLPLVSAIPEVRSEILAAVASGKEVTIHESSLTLGTSELSGYIIIDPEMGTGAFKISDGSNGTVGQSNNNAPNAAGVSEEAAKSALASYITPEFVQYTTCVINNAFDNLAEAAGMLIYKKGTLSFLRPFFGAAAPYAFWIVFAFLLMVYMQAIIECLLQYSWRRDDEEGSALYA